MLAVLDGFNQWNTVRSIETSNYSKSNVFRVYIYSFEETVFKTIPLGVHRQVGLIDSCLHTYIDECIYSIILLYLFAIKVNYRQVRKTSSQHIQTNKLY